MAWPFVGRDKESRAFQAALHAGQSGVVLSGGAGVGKSRLAVELVQSLDQGEPVKVLASASSSRIPLGAFASNLAVLSETHDSGAALLAAASDELVSLGAPLLVDDAHHLDAMSATLLQQSLFRGEMNLVATVRTGEDIPEAVTSLWKDDFLSRIDVEPLHERAVRRLVNLVLEGEVADTLIDELWRLSQGNVLYLRHLLEGAMNKGAIAQVDGRWDLIGSLSPSRRLVDLLADEIDRAGTAEVLRIVAVAEPIELDLVVELVGARSVDTAERQGMIRVERSERRVSISSAHPLFPEIALDLAGELEMRDLRSRTAAVIESTGMRRESDLLRVARLRLDGGADMPLEIAAPAARASLRLFDSELAERVLAAARRDADSHEARLLHARALGFLDRPDEAVEVLIRDMGLSESEADLADAATLAVDTLLFSGSRREAEELAGQVLSSLEDPVAKGRVATEAALVSLVTGDVDSAVDIGEPVLDTPDIPDLVRLGVLVTVTIGQPLSGRLQDIHQRIDRGLELTEHEGAPPLAIHQLTMNRFFTYQCEGQIDLAVDVGRRHWADVTEHGGPIAAVGMSVADALFEAADFESVIAVYEQALDAVERFDAFANRPNIHLWAATLAYQIGMDELGQTWESEAADESTDIRWIVRRRRIDAWKALSRGDSNLARDHYDQSADSVEEGGYRMWLLYALADAIRLGRAALVMNHIDRLAEEMDGETVQLFSRHAHALDDRDGSALDVLSARYREQGWILRSAEAAADAARAHRETGHEAESRRSAVRATVLSEEFTALTPPVRDIPDGLSDRELEVARLAASGLSNHEIADRLYLSVRTVENHLSRIYGKLEIPDRTGLAEFMVD